ncbi:hypothetical protein [Stutzerimonas tarimensis]|uniref:Secreted protein n=1 Tax=Stutzerimonas tarimensis TaxID=1507735 RepID=A0ABV7T0F9_9GAMM
MKHVICMSGVLLALTMNAVQAAPQVEPAESRESATQSAPDDPSRIEPGEQPGAPLYPHEHPDSVPNESGSGLRNPHFDTLPGEAPVPRGTTDPADPARPTTPLEPGSTVR